MQSESDSPVPATRKTAEDDDEEDLRGFSTHNLISRCPCACSEFTIGDPTPTVRLHE
jgi:hypothetical protein